MPVFFNSLLLCQTCARCEPNACGGFIRSCFSQNNTLTTVNEFALCLLAPIKHITKRKRGLGGSGNILCARSSMLLSLSCRALQLPRARRCSSPRNTHVSFTGPDVCKQYRCALLQQRALVSTHTHHGQKRPVCARASSTSQADAKQLSQNLPDSRDQAVSTQESAQAPAQTCHG